jgi:hypothetical protein
MPCPLFFVLDSSAMQQGGLGRTAKLIADGGGRPTYDYRNAGLAAALYATDRKAVTSLGISSGPLTS